MRIRQIALVAQDLPAVRNQLFELLGLNDAFVDDNVGVFGLQNIVTTIGDTFLEVVSPIKIGTTAGRLLKRRGGDGGYMVIVQVEDIEQARQWLADSDIRIVWEHTDGGASGMHLHPRDVPGALPSLDSMDPPEAWYYAGPDWEQRAARYASAITGAQVQVNDPVSAAERWSRAYNSAYTVREGIPVLALGDTEIRFIEIPNGRGEGLQAIDIRTEHIDVIREKARTLRLATEGDSVTVCGTVLNFYQ